MFASDRLALAVRYTELLATEGVTRGLIGPREAARLWERHVLNSAVLSEAIPHGATVCDIGTGAGLPGLVVAIARPDISMILVEPLLRRTTFLDEVVAELGLGHVQVVRGRAEDVHGKATYDVVTSRAVAPLERLLGWSMPLVAPTGALVAMKGQSVRDEIVAAGAALETWRCAPPEVLGLGRDVVDPQTIVVRVSWADPTQIGWPLARRPEKARRRQDRRPVRGKAN
ncbi:16S rRNA (guanine(527)-N(7))-methyltransferase RsmG [Nocardioides zhouii]|uniref:Ribosomal RNA small subunit methyltransferase G n=1 Tax=Nocardioides zhouii TaxID=1168729 RepID=A0A4Q2T2B7_9ACTN|nr:16S rRNA (guanine(527)-N(7))-methyltransferase RsmG [Nocardioides zhouii]RYC11074.1 16S rRNA (guanine(527)-N(7))-methyltransferase RsmG [Nocardioides zhouii]